MVKTLNPNPLTILVVLTFLGVAFSFYQSQGRERAEDYFYDVRTRIKPNSRAIDNVVLVSISSADIAKLEGRQEGLLSLANLVEGLRILETARLRGLLFLDFAHLFDYNDPLQQDVVEIVRRNESFFLGTLGLNSREPTLLVLPEVFRSIPAKVFGVDSLKKRSNSVVRDLPFYSFLGLEYRELAPLGVAKRVANVNPTNEERFYLNYVREEAFPKISFADILSEPASVQRLEGKIVVLGYTDFRQIRYQTNDQMQWNTPLKGDYNTYLKGSSTAYVIALALDNLVSGDVLEPLPKIVNILQVVFFMALCFFVWRLGAGLAPVVILVAWAGLFAIHVLCFSYLSVFLPMADVFLFSSGATVAGLLLRVQRDTRFLAIQRTKAEAQLELADLQSHFLDEFSHAIARMNRALGKDLGKLPQRTGDSMLNEVVLRSKVSCEEFGEYLAGIEQFANLENSQLEQPAIERFELAEVTYKVVRRFDAKLDEKHMRLEVKIAADVTGRGNAKIFDTILFNFISNAIKYAPEHSKITVYSEEVSDKLWVAVRDQGPGIPEKFREKIFEKFYRIKNDDVYKVKGTGLGLYLCMFFARRIGSEIQLVNPIAGGAEFRVSLGR